MTYRPENQALEEPINEILDGMKKFNERVDNRIESNEWESLHITKLNRVRKQMMDLQVELQSIKNETW